MAIRDFEAAQESYKEVLAEIARVLTPEQRLAGLTPEQRLAGLPPEQRLAGLTPEQIAEMFTSEQVLKVLPREVLDQISKKRSH